MEIRQITQVKVYKLNLNPMTDRAEVRQLVAVATDKLKLISWYNEQKALEIWQDGKWGKTFKQGSPLEWCNPLYGGIDSTTIETFGHGIFEEWVLLSEYENLTEIFKVE